MLNTVIDRIKCKMEIMQLKDTMFLKNVLLSFGVKGLAMIVSLINMPVFMRYFSDQSILGLWFTAISMLGWILNFDLGIGNGLRNYLVDAIEKKDWKEAKILISSAYCSIGFLVSVFALITYIGAKHIRWNQVFNINDDVLSQQVLTDAVAILTIGILTQFLLKLITSILYAMQKAAVPSFLTLLSNVLLLLATFVLNTGDPEKNLLMLSKAYIITANLPLFIATIWIFTYRLKNARVSIKCYSYYHTRKIICLGGKFLLLQILSMIMFNCREFFIIRLVGPEDVVPYQIYNKLFSLVSTFYILALSPMWSAVTQAIAQNDFLWIKKIYRKAKMLLVLFVLGSILVLMMAPILVRIWLGEESIHIDWRIGVLFVIVNIQYMWIILHCHLENGSSRIAAQKWGYIIACVLYPILSVIFCTSVFASWVSVMVANSIALFPMCIMQPIYLNTFLIKKDTEKEEKSSGH